MKTYKSPSHPTPAVGQLWDYVDEFKFLNITGESFIVIDVSDILYITDPKVNLFIVMGLFII